MLAALQFFILDVMIHIPKAALLQGWRDKSVFWHLLLKPNITKPITDTLLINWLAPL